MEIISSEFFLSVIAVLILYYIFPKKWQWSFLLAISIAFLWLNASVSAMIVFFSLVTVAWGGALIVEKMSGKVKTAAGALTVTALAGCLFCCKDMAFMTLIEKGLHSVFYTMPVRNYGILTLLGMSYFTLSLIGYVLDVCWGKYPAEKNLLKTMLFAGYFPQLISGPITHYDSMREELFSGHSFNADAIIMGAERTMWGCFEKIVLANSAALYSTAAFEGQSGLPMILGVLVYAIRLYADFVGSMDIILGISECLQITLPENFNTPFASHSLSEFWRRWHITMGTWFKEYLLYPLMKSNGFQHMNKKLRKSFGKVYGKKIATCVGLVSVWLAIGIWHGGSLTFILTSGLIPGFFLILEEMLEKPIDNLYRILHINKDGKLFGYLCRLWVLFAMCCSWTVMGSGNVQKAGETIARIFSGQNFNVTDLLLSQGGLRLAKTAFAFVLLVIVGMCHERGICIRRWMEQKPLWLRFGILTVLLLMILLFGIYGPEYNASDFIYKEF